MPASAPASVAGRFDIERFMEKSGQVDLSDIRWEDVPKYKLTPETLRVLRTFMGVESSTLLYAKPLLSTSAALKEPFGAFMAAWVYEEEFHGRAFKKFLEAYGEEIPKNLQRSQLFKNRTAGEAFEDVLQRIFSILTPDEFPAVHMTWGAIQEFTTYLCYQSLSKRAYHPILSVICERIMKQELKHFTFYYQQAKERLESSVTAQKLTKLILKFGWTPVGDGIMHRDEICHTIRYLFDGMDGFQINKIETKIQKLPGMEGFDLFTCYARKYELRAAPKCWFLDNPTSRAWFSESQERPEILLLEKDPEPNLQTQVSQAQLQV